MKPAVFLVLLGSLACSRADGAIVNGDFETGNFSGWTTQGDVSLHVPSHYASGGGFYASISSTETETPGRLSQVFSISGPSTLSFLYYSKASNPGSITYGLTNLDTLSTDVLVLTTIGEDLFDPPDFVPSHSHLISVPGNYELFVHAVSQGGSTYGEIENITIMAVPEPTTWVMALCGVAGLACFVRQRRA